MSKLYSPSTRGFYSEEVHGKSIPADALEISDEEWMALLDAQARGRVIRPGADGKPFADDLNDEELALSRKLARDSLLAETDWLVARHRDEIEAERSTTLSAENYKSLQRWRADLRDFTEDPNFPRVQFPPRPAGI
jgi:hypothetical protein